MDDVSGSDVDILKDVNADLSLWTKSLKTATNSKSHEKVTKEKLLRQTKETLVNCLLEGYQTVCSQIDKFEPLRVCMEQLKSELIAAQRSVVKLQQQILEAQAKQLDTMSNVVDTAVDKGIRTYSQALSQSIEESVSAFSEDKLKKAVQKAVTDDDRSKNVIVFGLAEEKSEDLDCKVTTLFEEIEEKPSFEAARIGIVSANKSRPVKVSFRNCETVHRLLIKAKKLKTSTNHKKVYIAPDRSPEEREKHRELVQEMRRQAKEDPDRYYFICSGAIGCRDKD